MFFLRIAIMAGYIRDLQSFKRQFEIRIDGSIVHLELRFQKPKSVFFYLLCDCNVGYIYKDIFYLLYDCNVGYIYKEKCGCTFKLNIKLKFISKTSQDLGMLRVIVSEHKHSACIRTILKCPILFSLVFFKCRNSSFIYLVKLN